MREARERGISDYKAISNCACAENNYITLFFLFGYKCLHYFEEVHDVLTSRLKQLDAVRGEMFNKLDSKELTKNSEQCNKISVNFLRKCDPMNRLYHLTRDYNIHF